MPAIKDCMAGIGALLAVLVATFLGVLMTPYAKSLFALPKKSKV